MDAMSFEVLPSGTATVVRLRGLMSLREVPVVRGVLLKCLAECPSSVVVDLSELTISASVVLIVFPSVQRRAADWPSVPLLLAGATGATAKALALSKIAVYADVEQALATNPCALHGRAQLRLRPTVRAAAQARAFVEDACAAWSLQELSPAAAVIITELVDNAATHARTDFVVTVAYRGVYLHLSVADQSPDPARLHRTKTDEPLEERPRRGLRLVDVFASNWGMLPTLDGKATWATLRAT